MILIDIGFAIVFLVIELTIYCFVSFMCMVSDNSTHKFVY